MIRKIAQIPWKAKITDQKNPCRKSNRPKRQIRKKAKNESWIHPANAKKERQNAAKTLKPLEKIEENHPRGAGSANTAPPNQKNQIKKQFFNQSNSSKYFSMKPYYWKIHWWIQKAVCRYQTEAGWSSPAYHLAPASSMRCRVYACILENALFSSDFTPLVPPRDPHPSPEAQMRPRASPRHTMSPSVPLKILSDPYCKTAAN